jgi:hypothetical protein
MNEPGARSPARSLEVSARSEARGPGPEARPKPRAQTTDPYLRAPGSRRALGSGHWALLWALTSRLGSGLWALGSGLVLACYPATTRPDFLPMPSASTTEVELGVPQATRAIAIALDADSIPVRRTEARDGWLESDWFDVATMRPTGRRRLGAGVVKVRAWIDPSRPNHSNITVETVFRPRADPSQPERELERQVPINHPVSGRVVKALGDVSRTYGGAAADSAKAKADSVIAKAKADSGVVRKKP